MNTHPRRARGFTLIEVMIVVAILGIIAIVALPSYQNSVRKTNRADAKTALMDTAQQLERCMTAYSSYDTTNCKIKGTDYDEDDTMSTTEVGGKGYYTITFTVLTASTFTLTATPEGEQVNDTSCAEFSITNTGARTAKDDAGDANAACW